MDKKFWYTSISIFKNWNRDCEDSYGMNFEIDWRQISISSFIHEETDEMNVKKFIRDHY